MAGEVWISVDGRAYFVQLHEEDILDYEPDLEPEDTDNTDPVSATIVLSQSKLTCVRSLKGLPRNLTSGLDGKELVYTISSLQNGSRSNDV